MLDYKSLNVFFDEMEQVQEITHQIKDLSVTEKLNLEQQNVRLVTEYQAQLLEKDAKKYWDLFYRRNETRFFKDRHWSVREFSDILNENAKQSTQRRTLLEVGCGVGNFIFPLIEENLNFYIIACDLSPRAIDMLKKNYLYNEDYIRAFTTDVTTPNVLEQIEEASVDIITLIFVLSAIHPDKFLQTLQNLYKLLKPGGIILFRDYGLHDMTQLRFKAGHKISDNFYMRQDGTRSYFFSLEFLTEIFTNAKFKVLSANYIHRRTVNIKENIDVPRIFIQGKFQKLV